MVVISKSKLVGFYSIYTKAEEPVLRWYYEVMNSDWNGLADIKKTFNSVDFVGNDRYVFNLGGNKYRLVAMIHFSKRTLYIRFIGTHKQYENIDCKTI